MKNNNKLQYLQKLATNLENSKAVLAVSNIKPAVTVQKNQNQKGTPYLPGQKKKQKSLRDSKKGDLNSISVIQNILDKKHDTFYEYNEMPINFGIYEDMSEAQQLEKRKKDRSEKLRKRFQPQIKLSHKQSPIPVKESIVSPKSSQMSTQQKGSILKQRKRSSLIENAPPKILIQKDDIELKKQNSGRSRKQVSINESQQLELKNKKEQLSPAPQGDSKLNLNANRKIKRVSSNDQVKIKKDNNNSDFTMSSIEMKDQAQDSNSIISEEDSAFEDQTPAHNLAKGKLATKDFDNAFQKKEIKPNETLLADGQNSKTSLGQNKPILNLKTDETVANNKKYVKQKTLGWKQTKHDTTRWPFKRSPTHKSRGADEISQGSRKKFKMKPIVTVTQGDDLKKKGFGQQSRHSSLNYTIDNQIDQLSVNFGKVNSKKRLNKGGNAESQSVVSVITKNGTVVNPFNLHQKDSKKLIARASTKSNSKFKHNQFSARSNFKDIDDNKKLTTGERNLEQKSLKGLASKTHVKFGNELDLDLKKSLQKANQKMIQIYLKTPYKVLTINEIKSREREQSSSPVRLFRAENNLKIHTNFRGSAAEKNNQSLKKQNGALILVQNVNDDESSAKKKKQNLRDTRNSLHKDFSISQMSDTKMSGMGASINQQKVFHGSPGSNSKNVQAQSSQNILAMIDTESNPNVSQYDLVSGQNQIQLTSSQIKQLRQQKQQIENDFKQRFYDQLQNQLEKKIEQVNFQTNVLRKQKNLYNIYGGGSLNTQANFNKFHDATLIVASQDQDFDKAAPEHFMDSPPLINEGAADPNQRLNDKRFQHMFKQQQKLGKIQLYLPQGKNKKKAEAEILGKNSIMAESKPVDQSTNRDSSLNIKVSSPKNSIKKIMQLNNTNGSQVNNEDSLEVQEIEEEQFTRESLFDIGGLVQKTGANDEAENLKQLLEMSHSLGYTQLQLRDLREKQRALEEAEKRLHKQQVLKAAVGGTRNNHGSTGGFIVGASFSKYTNSGNGPQRGDHSIDSHKCQHARLLSQTAKKTKENKLAMLTDNQSLEQEKLKTPNQKPIVRKQRSILGSLNSHEEDPNQRSIENEGEVKDYFDNKISLRRSIEQKLHYDPKNYQKVQAHQYQTSAQKHNQQLKQMRKDKYQARVIEINDQTRKKPIGSHLRHKTYMSNPIKPQLNNSALKNEGTLLPAIKQSHTTSESKHNGILHPIHSRQNQLFISTQNQRKAALINRNKRQSYDEKEQTLPTTPLETGATDHLDTHFYPLKKSGTTHEKPKNDKLSPIRDKKTHVLMAQISNAANPLLAGAYNANGDFLTLKQNSSKKQLGFQFTNKSPRPNLQEDFQFENQILAQSFSGNVLPQDKSYKTSPAKGSKFILNKQAQLFKGVLNHQRKFARVSSKAATNADQQKNVVYAQANHGHSNTAQTLPQIVSATSNTPKPGL